MTSLFHDIIFGPVHSRRLGLSLGVNLLPTESKLCSFDCIYCECGWNAEHPEFEAVIGDTIALRDELCPSARVSVLSNATQLHREGVRRALRSVDNNILKLDSAFDATARLINNPQSPVYSVRRVVDQMKGFDGHLTVQTMFLRGEFDGQRVDNTTEEEVAAWLRLIGEIRPRQVMVYSLDRDTPCRTLEKVPREELQAIATRVEALGIPCSVA